MPVGRLGADTNLQTIHSQSPSTPPQQRASAEPDTPRTRLQGQITARSIFTGVSAKMEKTFARLDHKRHKENPLTERVVRIAGKLLHQKSSIQKRATETIANLSEISENQRPLMQIPNLVDGLASNFEHTDVSIRQFAARAISCLAFHPDNRVPLREHEGLVAGLVTNLHDEYQAVRLEAVHAISELASHSANQVPLRAQEGLVTGLIANLENSNTDIRQSVLRIVSKLATDRDNRVPLREQEGLVAGLVANLESPDTIIRQFAARAISNLAFHRDNRVPLREQEGLVAGLVTNLESPNSILRESVIRTISNLALHHDNRVPLREQEGLVAGLTANLGEHYAFYRNNGAHALYQLGLHPNNREPLRQQHNLVEILRHDPRNEYGVIRIALGAVRDPAAGARHAPDPAIGLQAFANNAQNTHTASVHQSASENAQRLRDRFPNANIDQAYRALSRHVQALPTEGAALQNGIPNQQYRNRAAKEWIANPAHIEHLDTRSNVTVREMLSLFWLASQNDETRESSASRKDAESAMVNALYEIRRGYNISGGNPGRDNGEPAHNICARGTFNKLSEKMVTVIQGTSQRVITPEVFNTTAGATIRRAVTNSPAAQKAIIQSNDGTLTENAWNEIRETVASDLRNEFEGIDRIGHRSTEARIEEYLDYENSVQYMTFDVARLPTNRRSNTRPR